MTDDLPKTSLVLQHVCFVAIHKHYSIEEWVTFAREHKEVLEVMT